MTEERTTSARRNYAAPALERGFDILELFATDPVSLTISEIAARLGRSVSEVFRIIIVMERRGWLKKDRLNDRYSVSHRVLDVGFRATPVLALSSVAAPHMQALATAANQSCHLVVRTGNHGIVVQRQENAGPSGFAMRAGAVIDLITSCSGHVLLAHEPEAEVEAIVAVLGPDRAREWERVQPRLAMVRDRGHEMQPSARAAGVTDISAPIFGFDGRIAAALTIPYLVMIDGSQATDLNNTRTALVEAAAAISGDLGAPMG